MTHVPPVTTSVICMRECSSLACTCTAKMETCEVSISQARRRHIDQRPGGKVFKQENVPIATRSASWAPSAAAIVRAGR